VIDLCDGRVDRSKPWCIDREKVEEKGGDRESKEKELQCGEDNYDLIPLSNQDGNSRCHGINKNKII